MKLRNLFMAVVAGAAMLVGCNKEVDLGPAKLALDQTTLAFEAAGGSQTLNVTATRDWAVSGVPEWVALSATSGKAAVEAQPVKITVAQNTEYNRSATIVFTIGFARTSLTINQAGPEGEIDNGDGTLEKPFNVAGVLEYTRSLPADQASEKNVYFKGKISTVSTTFEASGTYGNATFYMVDGDGGESFYVFQTYYLGNRKWKSGDTDIKEGDEVIVCGKVVNYKGNTPETVSKGGSFIYSLNGETEGGGGGETGEPKGTGTAADPFNVAAAIAKAVETGETATASTYYIKGKVGSVTDQFNAQYGNATFTMIDAGFGATFTAYRVLYFNNKKWALGGKEIKAGDEVVVCAKIVNFKGNTPETSGGYVVSINGEGGSDTPGEEEDYSKAEAKTVAEFIAAADENTYFKLTGTVSKFNATYCSFDLTDASGTIYVYSVLASYKTEWASKISNGGTVTIAGKYAYYAKNEQHEVVDAAILSFEGGDEPGGETDYANAEAKTVAEFIAAADENTYFKLTGTVGGTINATYGNFDLTDDSGTIYVYGTKNWSDWKAKVKNGSTVTLAAKYKLYQKEGQADKDEAVEAYILSCEGGEDPEPGGDGNYASNVTWTDGSNNSYTQDATVNGVTGVQVLKLGTGSATGSSTLTLPAGSTKLTFYALSWKGKASKLVFKKDGTEVAAVEPATNDGLAGNPTYTITVSDSDKYTITFSATSTLTVETSGSNTRAALFAVVAAAE